jgi:hypothetical protein
MIAEQLRVLSGAPSPLNGLASRVGVSLAEKMATARLLGKAPRDGHAPNSTLSTKPSNPHRRCTLRLRRQTIKPCEHHSRVRCPRSVLSDSPISAAPSVFPRADCPHRTRACTLPWLAVAQSSARPFLELVRPLPSPL